MKTRKLSMGFIALASAFVLAISGMGLSKVSADEPSTSTVEHSVDFVTESNNWETTYGKKGYLIYAMNGTTKAAYTNGLYGSDAQMVLYPGVGNGTAGTLDMLATDLDSQELDFAETSPISKIGIGNNFSWRSWDTWQQGVNTALACAKASLKIPEGLDSVMSLLTAEYDGEQTTHGSSGFGNKYVTDAEGLTDIVECWNNAGEPSQDTVISFTLTEDGVGANGIKVTMSINPSLGIYYTSAAAYAASGNDYTKTVDTSAVTYRVALQSSSELDATGANEGEVADWTNVIDYVDIDTTREKSGFVTFEIKEAGDYMIRIKDVAKAYRVGFNGIFFDECEAPAADNTVTEDAKSGCGSVIGTTIGLVSLVSLAGAAFVTSRKEN